MELQKQMEVLTSCIVRFLHRVYGFPVTVGSRAQQYSAESITSAEEISRCTWLVSFVLVNFPTFFSASLLNIRMTLSGLFWVNCRYHCKDLTSPVQLHDSMTLLPSKACTAVDVDAIESRGLTPAEERLMICTQYVFLKG